MRHTLTEMSVPLLRVVDLTTVFTLSDGREATAVDRVSFDIPRGEILGLVGESGSGKSVTALSISRLVDPPGRIAAGRIELDGRDLLTLDERTMRQVRGREIGFVFQEPMVALDPVRTIGAQIEETLAAHGLARGRAARRRSLDLLDSARVPDAARRAGEYPHQLSGGIRQRAMIALAIAAEPALIIADEPTTALDVTVQSEILDLLRDLRTRLGVSMLLITHDLAVVSEIADRVAVMYYGRIVELARTAALLDEPAHPYTRALIESMPGVHKGRRLRSIPGAVPGLGAMPRGCAFAPRCDHRMPACADVPESTTLDSAHHVSCFLHAQ